MFGHRPAQFLNGLTHFFTNIKVCLIGMLFGADTIAT